MRLIDIEDVALLKTVTDGGLSAKALWRRINSQPTVDAVVIEFIEEQIKEAEKVEEWELNNLGQIDNMYSSAYQNLLKAWAERKEE